MWTIRNRVLLDAFLLNRSLVTPAADEFRNIPCLPIQSEKLDSRGASNSYHVAIAEEKSGKLFQPRPKFPPRSDLEFKTGFQSYTARQTSPCGEGKLETEPFLASRAKA